MDRSTLEALPAVNVEVNGQAAALLVKLMGDLKTDQPLAVLSRALGVLEQAIAAGKLDAKKAIDADVLIAAGVVRRKLDGVKLLGKGELTSKLNITCYSATASARAAVEKAGGTLTTTKKEAAAEEA